MKQCRTRTKIQTVGKELGPEGCSTVMNVRLCELIGLSCHQNDGEDLRLEKYFYVYSIFRVSVHSSLASLAELVPGIL